MSGRAVARAELAGKRGPIRRADPAHPGPDHHHQARIAGLKLNATDSDRVWGDGPAGLGPLISLILAMTDRTGADSDLTGVGLATLQGRR